MGNDSRYALQFLFDASQITPDQLDERARALLRKHLPKIDLHVKSIKPGGVELSITGSLKDVDACHGKVNEELFERHSCVRVLDEAGDQIRQRAYPILAQIEQGLRTFLNRAMAEVIGFDWWDSMSPPDLRTSVELIERKAGKVSAIHHPLDLTYFEQLVDMVTASVQEWDADRALSAADLADLLCDSDSMDEVQEKLAGKTRKISLWDEVFARYFDQQGEWSDLAKQLHDSVIPARNKVMHHRPIRLYELQHLSEIHATVRTLLSSAKPELPQEERAEARQVSMDFIDVTREQAQSWATLQRAALEPIGQQQTQGTLLQKAVLESIRQEEAQGTPLQRAVLEVVQRQEAQWTPLQRAVLELVQRQEAQWTSLQRAVLELVQRPEAQWTSLQQAVLELCRQPSEQMALALQGLAKPPSSEVDGWEGESRVTYRVYENWSARPDKAIIHRADCSYANDGPIRPPTKNGQWHGPFATFEEALEAAKGTGRKDVRGCKYCSPSRP